MNEGLANLERISSGIPGLDTITNGGFFRGGLYLIQGTPGTGKTTLANQIAFHRAALGDRALYVTLLAEYHSRMVQYLQHMSFFDADMLPDRLTYISAFGVMRADGLGGLLSFMRRELIAKRVSLLVVDGLIAAQRIAPSDQAFNEFVHELQGIAVATGCTVFVLASAKRDPHTTPEHTMVDGVIELSDQVLGWATERALTLSKIRGTSYLRGKHTYKITDDGIVTFPRLEALLPPSQTPSAELSGRVSSGIADLDAMLGGGLPGGSPTMMIGPTGVGKTSFGLQFLSTCSSQEPGLLFGFYETPARIVAKAKSICEPLCRLLDNGVVEMLWQPPTSDSLDDYADRLLKAVKRRGVRRLFWDGLGALKRAEDASDRLSQFLPALSNELRLQGVTTLYTWETSNPMAPNAGDSPVDSYSALPRT